MAVADILTTKVKTMTETIIHTIAPVYNAQSKVLILGTIPSPKSRETGFFYGHPQNRFWRVMADLFAAPLPQSIEEKTCLLLQNHIALWDTLYACEITGAGDSTIRNPVPNDFTPIFKTGRIKAVFTSGQAATKIYNKYSFPVTGIKPIYLPSTSPANCRLSYKELLAAYGQVKNYL